MKAWPAKWPGRRWAYRTLGVAAVSLGLAGVVLPLLPTTPFVLVAAWAFARSSPRLEAWLRQHPRLGPSIAAWEARQAIPAPAKAAAGVSLPLSWGVLYVMDVGAAPLIASGVILAAVGAWILTRPS